MIWLSPCPSRQPFFVLLGRCACSITLPSPNEAHVHTLFRSTAEQRQPRMAEPAAYSGHRDRSFRSIVISDFGDHDHSSERSDGVGLDGLAPGLPPTHPRTLHPFGRERLARGFDDSGADGEVLRLRLRIAHAVTVAAKVSKLVESFFLRRWVSPQSARMTFSTPSASSRRRWRCFSNSAFDRELFSPYAASKAAFRARRHDRNR